MTTKTISYWSFNQDTGWKKKRFANHAIFDEIEDFFYALEFNETPSVLLGDEFSYLAVFKHIIKDLYLCQLKMDNFNCFVFAENLPSMFILIEKLNVVLNTSFKTTQILESMINER